MNRRTTLLAAALLLAVTACTPGNNKNTEAAPTATEASGTVEFWHPFTEREAQAVETVIADFKAKYPKIDVKITGGQDDPKMLQAISAGKGPDVGLSYSTDIVGKFCSRKVCSCAGCMFNCVASAGSIFACICVPIAESVPIAVFAWVIRDCV